MGDSVVPNPWRPDPSGGLVFQDVELRHDQGSVRWTDDDGGTRALIASQDTTVAGVFDRQRLAITAEGDDKTSIELEAQAGGYINSLTVSAEPDGTTEARIGTALLLNNRGHSDFIRSGWPSDGPVNMRVRAGQASNQTAIYIPAHDAQLITFEHSPATAYMPVPDLVMAQVTGGGTLAYHLWVQVTSNYTATSFDAQIRSAFAWDLIGGSLLVNFIAVFFDLA